MNAAADRLEFAPPPQPGFFRALVLALIAHALLLLALAWGVQWKRDAQDLAAEAELWSSLPQEAAPEVVKAPPVQAPPVQPPPAPVQREEPKPQPREADIALEREKKRKELEARREAEEERKEQQRRRAEAQRKQEEARKLQQEKLAEARQKEEERKRKEKAEEARIARLREENLRRIQGLAGGGAPSSTGVAAQASGPSGSWAGRVRARVRPNIVFTDDVAGNPEARVEVRMAPDGTIVSKRVVKSSGLRSWDDAVLRALDKTEVLPRDVDGRVHSPVELIFRPKD